MVVFLSSGKLSKEDKSYRETSLKTDREQQRRKEEMFSDNIIGVNVDRDKTRYICGNLEKASLL